MKKRLKRTYKDSLFIYLFGHEKRAEFTLSLYNALNKTDIKNTDELKYNAIEPVFYNIGYNDVSFLVNNEMNIYEHQSTFNPNISLKALFYVASLYKGYLAEENMSVHYQKKLRIPILKVVMFYNGLAERPDDEIIRLSDLYAKESENVFELETMVLNINFGHNMELMKKCKPLYEYSWLIHEIRQFQSLGQTIDEAFENVIMEMPEDFIIRDIILRERAEVAGMIRIEFDEEQDRKFLMKMLEDDARKEGREEGLAEGRKEGKAEGILETTEKYRTKMINRYISQGMSVDEANRLCDEFFSD